MATQSKKASDQARAKEAVLSKAALRAADHLDISGNALAEIIGISAPSISRMKAGQYLLSSSEKTYELAALFVRLFRSLDAMSGGDDGTSRSWLQNENTVLRGRPIERIKSIPGLFETVNYIDTRRAKI